MTKLFTYPTGEVNCWDEVGRGALVGAVVTAAVILQDPTQPITRLTNSNKLNKKQRFALYKNITRYTLAWSIQLAKAQEIDRFNIFQATMLAMQQAVAGMAVTPDFVLLDGTAFVQCCRDQRRRSFKEIVRARREAPFL
ncbi:MAG: Ribonuclease HII [Sodalis sp. Ffu]|nr:MAG: Ribonuclease HII [Sodalis sp. Ffu]